MIAGHGLQASPVPKRKAHIPSRSLEDTTMILISDTGCTFQSNESTVASILISNLLARILGQVHSSTHTAVPYNCIAYHLTILRWAGLERHQNETQECEGIIFCYKLPLIRLG